MVRPDRTYTRRVETQAYVMDITTVTNRMNVKGTCRKPDVPFIKLLLFLLMYGSNMFYF